MTHERITEDGWIPVTEKLPSRTDIGRGFICTLQPHEGKPYVAEMCWLGGRRPASQWQGDWSGRITAWRHFPEPYKGKA